MRLTIILILLLFSISLSGQTYRTSRTGSIQADKFIPSSFYSEVGIKENSFLRAFIDTLKGEVVILGNHIQVLPHAAPDSVLIIYADTNGVYDTMSIQTLAGLCNPYITSGDTCLWDYDGTRIFPKADITQVWADSNFYYDNIEMYLSPYCGADSVLVWNSGTKEVMYKSFNAMLGADTGYWSRDGDSLWATSITDLIGIGDSTPNYKMTIEGAVNKEYLSYGDDAFFIGDDDTPGGLGIWWNNSSGDAYIGNIKDDINSDIHFMVRSDDGGSQKKAMTLAGTGYVGIGTAAPAYLLDVDGGASINTLNINSVYTFPVVDGSANQVIETNGSGVLSWVNVSSSGGGGGTRWDSTYRSINPSYATRVGIGTAYPIDTFQVLGNSTFSGEVRLPLISKTVLSDTGIVILGDSIMKKGLIWDRSSGTASGEMYHHSSEASGAYAVSIGYQDTASGYSSITIGFRTKASGAVSFAGGAGDASGDAYTIASGAGAFNFSTTYEDTVVGAAMDRSFILGGGDNGIKGGGSGLNSGIIGGDLNLIQNGAKNSLILGGLANAIYSSADYSIILGGANITATEDSTAYMYKLAMTYNPTSGYVLTSDASGNASWQAVSMAGETDPIYTAAIPSILFWTDTLSSNPDSIITGYDLYSWLAAGAVEINDLNDGISDLSSVYLGDGAGVLDDLTTNENTGVGEDALSSVITGVQNTAVGVDALLNNTGSYNTAIGWGAAQGNTTGTNNTTIGWGSGGNTGSGYGNMYMGAFSGFYNVNESMNVVIGWKAGGASGSAYTGCVLIGNEAGNTNTVKDSSLWITNNQDLTPLIYGEFNNDLVRINGTLEVETMPTADKAYFVVADAQGEVLSLMDTTGYKGGGTETDPIWISDSVTYSAKSWVLDQGFLTSYTETDPIWISDSVTYMAKSLARSEIADSTNWAKYGTYLVTDNLITRVGIGTTSPAYMFDVAGSASVNSLNINSVYTFPSVDGAANQVIETNGSGVLSWVDVSGGGGGDTSYFDLASPEIQLKDGLTDIDLGTYGTLSINDTNLVRKYKDNYIFGSQNTTITSAASGNTFLGFEAGKVHTSGDDNTFIGDKAGDANNTGFSNTFVGKDAGTGNQGGFKNVGIGVGALRNNFGGDYNVAIGHDAMRDQTSNSSVAIGFESMLDGSNNLSSVAIGYQSMETGTNNSSSVAIGYRAMQNSTGATRNVAIGNAVMEGNSGDYNTMVGAYSGLDGDGDYNVFLGYYTGYSATGSSNVFLGAYAGQNATTSNTLYIDNSNTTTPLIFGDFAADTIRINGGLSLTNIPVGTSDTVLIIEGHRIKKKYLAASGGSGIDSWEQEVATDADNNWTVSFTIASTSVISYNGQTLASSQWSGSGTTTLNISVTTYKYDKITVIQ